ncbi:putative nuclease HARBI1 [Mya arenaria]|uniref:putative nuclease HARBI1 n=1 Tax=Mya arenaria TaxID=6604 RepID=UPI0022E0C593|nr:putative nuclease HARBI1 [Mya arenaria]
MTNVRRIINLCRKRKILRRKVFLRTPDFNPLDELSDEEIFARYRFRRETILFILDLIDLHVRFATARSMAVSPLMQLLAALNFYATGAFWKTTGDSLKLSAATVHRCVHRVSKALSDVIDSMFIRFPTPNELETTKRSFYEKSGFPDVVGAIDVFCIRIVKPMQNDGEYFNRKGYHSYNLQVTCDTNTRITSCEERSGSVDDATMFQESEIRKIFEQGSFEGVLVGDSAFPCEKHLMVPYLETDSESHERYNNAHSEAREPIEQTFELIKRRFACLNSGLRVEPEKARTIIRACVVLHNIGLARGDLLPASDTDGDSEDDAEEIPDMACEIGCDSQYREQIRKKYFCDSS